MDSSSTESASIIRLEKISFFSGAQCFSGSRDPNSMWNFGIPYRLKHYIAVVWQPGFMFKYTENGPVGLAAGRKVIVVSSRGGDYTPGTPAEAYDQIIPYLKTVLGWAGITDQTYISVQPMDANTEEGRETRIKEAIARIDSLALV